MTVNPLKQSVLQRSGLLAMAVVAVFAISTYVLTRPDPQLQSLSPVSGLVALKASTQTAVPYQAALANPKPTLVEFYADWCTTCQAMAPSLQALHQQFGEQVNFVMLNIDAPQWQGPMQRFRVSGVPHLVLLAADQTPVDSFVGKVPQQVLSARLVDLLS